MSSHSNTLFWLQVTQLSLNLLHVYTASLGKMQWLPFCPTNFWCDLDWTMTNHTQGKHATYTCTCIFPRENPWLQSFLWQQQYIVTVILIWQKDTGCQFSVFTFISSHDFLQHYARYCTVCSWIDTICDCDIYMIS